MRPQASIGLLWDSVSENMGDEAIGLILQRIFARHQIPASVIHPFKPDLSHIASMVVGGGELIRAPGDPFYDAFRVRGAHILNTVGVVNGTETEYLSEYSLVSTRSEADRAKIGSAGEVCPCITLLYKDYLPPTTLPVDIPDNAIGVHVMPASVPDLIALKDLLTELAPQPIVWLPITHYAHDLRVMQTLANQVPGSVVLPRLSPDECYEAIGRLKLLITSSFHGGLFAYSQGIPFLWRKHYPKLGYFLQDRQRESDLVESSEQLHDMLPQWLNSPPDYSALRAADQARCRGWVDRMMSQADEALRTPPAASFSVPRTDYETYQAKRQLDQLQAEFISGQLADKFAVAERQQIVPQDEPEASEREAAPADAITVPKQKDDVVTEMDQMLVLAAERALAIRRLEKEIRERERQKHDVEEQQYSLMENNAQLREELTALQNTRVVRLAQTYWWPLRRRLQRPRKVAAPTVDSSELVYSLKTRLPGALQIGRGIALPVSGWCYSQRGTFRSLAIMVNDEAHPVVMHSEAQLDVFSSQCPNVDQSGNSLLSGFFAVLDFPEIAQQQTVRLSLRAQLENGEIVVQPLGEIQLVPGYGAQPLTVQWRSTSQARVAVCMTTYKPPLDLFTAQIASIKAQTHQNWVCIISDDSSPIGVQNEIRSVIADDDRFIFMAHNERVGVYRNFERCLTYVPADTDFVALSDQDDKWDADKLETLAAAFDAETQLVYADMRVVDRAGKILSDTFWTTRRNNYTDLAALLFANTITGAASMFRASLLAEMLPMPEKVIDEYHDHWLGLTALVKGKIAFVNRPLHSYVQHDGNVFGYKQEQSAPGLLGAALIMLRASRNRMKLQATGRMFLGDAVDSYPMVIHKIAWAETLLLRQPNAAASKRNFLKRMSTLRRSLMPLMVESLSAVIRRRPSLRMEQYHLRVALGTRLWNAYFRREKQRLLMSQLQHSQAVTLAAGAPSAPQPASLPNLSKIQALRYGNTDWIAHNISPLTLKPSDRYPRRANLLLATIDFRYVFGGYLAMFNLALHLHRAGYKTRIILVEKTDFNPEAWRDQIQRYPGLESLFDDVEVIYRYDRTIPVEVNPDDAFVATSCWTAHIANHALKHLKRDSFTFLVQDYEPVFVPMNSVHALFSEAYTFPQYNLFSTGLLRDYFRLNQIGIYADSAAYGDERSTAFENAIYKATVDGAALRRERKRLLFYARPEPHAARNMFELGMLSLIEAVRSGEFDVSKWSFHGIGSIDMNVRLELAPDVELQLVPRSSPQQYVEMLPTFDVGLSLMLTPHPSLVPLEMASAGMWTVTNSYANKTRDKLEAISSNLIVAEPTISGIKAGLLQAIAAVDDVDSRVRGSDVHWATDWNTAFNDQVIDKLRTFLD